MTDNCPQNENIGVFFCNMVKFMNTTYGFHTTEVWTVCSPPPSPTTLRSNKRNMSSPE